MKTDDISKLELLLVQKEIPVLQAEIQRGMDIVFAAFDKYRPKNNETVRVTDGQLKDLNAFISGISPLRSYYYSGDHLAVQSAGSVISPATLPNFVRNLMLDHVVPEFVDRINALEEATEEIRNIAEQAAHYAQEG